MDILNAQKRITFPREHDLKSHHHYTFRGHKQSDNYDYQSRQFSSGSSNIIRQNRWHTHHLDRTIKRYESEQRRAKVVYDWHQQQFFINKVFDRFGEIRYREPKSKLSPIKTISQPSPIRPTASTKLKQTNKSNAKEEKIEKRASLSKIQTLALLRDGLFKPLPHQTSNSVPRTFTRHAAANKQLTLNEKQKHKAASSSLPAVSQKAMTKRGPCHQKSSTLPTMSHSRFRLASIMEESPELMTNAPPVRTEERLRARVQRRRNSINEQSIDIVNEARRTVFSRRPTLTKNKSPAMICDDTVIWRIVSHLPTKYMKTAYQSGYQLIEERQRGFIKQNVDRIKALSDAIKSL